MTAQPPSASSPRTTAKYAWETPEDEAFLVARPHKVFAFIETSESESQFAETATRWRFDDRPAGE